MTKNPILNALMAVGYITLVGLFFRYGTQFLSQKEDTFFAPIAMLSLLVLSAALMALFFFFTPVQLYLDGSKKEAVNLILRTVTVFASITALIFAGLFIHASL